MIVKIKDSYRLEEKGRIFYVQIKEEIHCPTCQELLKVRASREWVWWRGESDINRHVLIMQHLYCEKCEQIHHKLPDCIVPFKRYGADVIENIATTSNPTVSCPPDTIRRIKAWWEAVKSYFLSVILILTAKYGVSFGKPLAFREMVRAVANSNNWIFA
ncbi:MAG: DUF6431 domain-containing protein [Defluviitaleaceae bacterium]|nr:DUF6431 domain-containing protein [Defluviitaleaceae bacterium]